jgi:hypothetical protein
MSWWRRREPFEHPLQAAIGLHQPSEGRDPLVVDDCGEIDAASIDTGVADRDAHLRSPDFLDVERYPTLEFRSSDVRRNGEGWKVDGELTVRDVTRPVTLELEYLGVINDQTVLGFEVVTEKPRLGRPSSGRPNRRTITTSDCSVSGWACRQLNEARSGSTISPGRWTPSTNSPTCATPSSSAARSADSRPTAQPRACTAPTPMAPSSS